MPDAFWYMIPATIGALTSAYIAWKQHGLIKQTNGLVDKLIKSKEGVAFGKGQVQGQADEKANPTP
jgi:hypothetical protein